MAGPEPSFAVTVSRSAEPEGGPARIVVSGELDSAAAPQLSEAFRELASARGPSGSDGRPEITLDLSAVTFIDSTGLRAVIAVERESVRRELGLTVVAPPEDVTGLLRMAGITDRISLVGDGQGPRPESDFLERLELDFPMREDAPRLARSAVREALNSVLDDEALATVVLMTSEVVTNAVRHPSSRTPPVVGMRVMVLPGAVRIEVDDPGDGFDPAGRIIPDGLIPDPGEGGRGLFVVDRCAARWGSRYADTDRGQRFSVWFEVDAD